MGKSSRNYTDFECNSCHRKYQMENFEDHGPDFPFEQCAEGLIKFKYYTKHAGEKRRGFKTMYEAKDWWLCEDCAKILERFLIGDIGLDDEKKHLLLLDDRLNGWWTEYCRMQSALKSLGHNIEPIKDGTSALVGEGFKKGQCGDS